MLSEEEQQEMAALLKESQERLRQRLTKLRGWLKAINAYYDQATPGNAFMWAPVVDGEPLYLPGTLEKECCYAIKQTLAVARQRIEDRISQIEKVIE